MDKRSLLSDDESSEEDNGEDSVDQFEKNVLSNAEILIESGFPDTTLSYVLLRQKLSSIFYIKLTIVSLVVAFFAIVAGIFFPRSPSVVLYKVVQGPIFADENQFTVGIKYNITLQIENENYFPVILKDIYLQFYDGPLLVGNLSAYNLDLDVEPLEPYYLELPLEVFLNGEEVINNIASPVYRGLMYLLFQNLINNVLQGDIMFHVVGEVTIVAMDIQLELTEDVDVEVDFSQLMNQTNTY
eukprot:TRINITY_DN12579_c0_g1_i1.p1 TRINITY_DN12579_c0_g1~~TRINITY_DN12579_c0_g1_i1.p1  ORF type:complete len:242 (-),score=38.98 TRINITY_DN12579_c0_g1_i1:77-802(-)